MRETAYTGTILSGGLEAIVSRTRVAKAPTRNNPRVPRADTLAVPNQFTPDSLEVSQGPSDLNTNQVQPEPNLRVEATTTTR